MLSPKSAAMQSNGGTPAARQQQAAIEPVHRRRGAIKAGLPPGSAQSPDRGKRPGQVNVGYGPIHWLAADDLIPVGARCFLTSCRIVYALLPLKLIRTASLLQINLNLHEPLRIMIAGLQEFV
jgi:hypothetical protein